MSTKKNLQKTLRFSTSLLLILQLIIGLSYSWVVYAEEPLPDRNQLTNQIYTEVNQGLQNNDQAQQDTNNQQDNGDGGAQTEVVNSGDDASVDNTSSDSTNTTVNNNNNADVNQDVNATANTGYNQAKGNISFGGNAGIISTGNAGVNVSGTANVNNNNTGVSGGGSTGGSGTSVVNSGKNLSTTTSKDGSTTTVVNNNNNATIHQGANTTANTGNNDASGNIAIGGGVAGLILTGDAWTDISFMTVANGSATLVGGTGGGNGPGTGADIYITNTGGRFSGINRAYVRANTLVNNANNATVNQTCGGKQGGCTAITGGNSSNNNIAFGADAGVIHTGDAIVNVEMNASVNDNKTAIKGTGAGGADANADVVNTGDDLNVDNEANSQSNTVVNNNNNARINQRVNAVADTGHNTANYNISFGGNAGVITTGDAIVNVVLNADANNNDTQISEPSAGMGGGSGAHTDVINSGNNAQINNNSTTNNNTIVNNNNYLDLNQSANVVANTGNNTASDNISTGCGCSGRYACISPCTAAGGIAGGIYTGDAFIQTFMSVVANHNNTTIGDPAIGGPADPADPASNTGSNTQSNTATPTTAVTPTYVVNAGTGGTAIIAGTASQLTAQGTVKKIGKVLGATAKKLPSTGAEDTLMIFAIATALFSTGLFLKRLNINNVSSRKEVKQ